MKRVWSGQPASDEVGPIGPPPARPGGPELLIGGNTPPAIRRVGRWGDGYISGGIPDPEQVRQLFDLAEESWRAGGRAGRGSWRLSTTPSARTRSGEAITYAPTTVTSGRAPTTWRAPSPPPPRPSRGSSAASARGERTRWSAGQ